MDSDNMARDITRTMPRRLARGRLRMAFPALALLALAILPRAAGAQATWTLRNPTTPPVSLHALSWTGSQLVAVGDGGTITTSPSATTWTRRDGTNMTASLYGAVSNGTTLTVAVGQGGAIYTSTNGTGTWTSRNSPTTKPLYGVTWSGSVYVAVGDSGTIVTSGNGTGTWTLRDSPRLRALNGVAFGNGVFVAVGDSGIVLTSANGTDWADRLSGVTTALLGVKFANNTFVAMGFNGVILTSPDGVTWTPRTTGVSAYLSSAAYDDGFGTWIVVGNSGVILSSTNLADWTPLVSGVGTALRSIVWTGNQFVVVGVSGEVLASANRVDWTRLTSNKANLFGVASDDEIVAVGASGTLLTSPDGSAWTARTPVNGNMLSAVSDNGTRYVAVGNAGTILTSTEAVTWTPQAAVTVQRFNAVRWGATQFVAVGNGGVIATSPDGLTWTLRNSGTTNALFSVAWTGTQYVAVGASGTILASPDGVAWSERASGTTAPLYAVRSFNEGVMAVGGGGIALWSPDGVEWTSMPTGTTNGLYALTWSGSRLVAAGAGGTVVTTPNGISWDVQASGVATDLNALEWTGSQYVAVGLGGVILTSPASGSLPSAPAIPTLSSPAQNAVSVSTSSPTLQWSSVNGATFRVQVALDPAFATLVRDDSGFTSNSRGAGTLAANTVYYWRVRAKANGYSSHWSEVRNFSTGTLAPPTLTAPAAGATGVSLSPTLTWSTVSGAVSYHVQLSISSTFATPLLDDSTLTTTSRSLFGLGVNTVYYWRVRAKNASGVSAWSAARSFTTVASPPAAPGLVSPANLTANVSVFTGYQWSAAPGATDYRIQVATDSLFTALVLHDSLITGLTRPGGQLAGNTIHYWRVQARNPVGEGDWSQVARFTTGATPTTPPGKPTLSTPAQFSTGVALSREFTWTAAAGAASHHIQISTSPTNFTLPVFEDSLVTGTSRTVTGLSGSSSYYWRVRGINNIGKGEWSDVWTFSTVAAAPSAAPALVAPAQFATDVAIPAALSWSAVSGATGYTVEISTSSDFPALSVIASTVTGLSLEATGLAGNTVYYWRVRANNSAGMGPYSESRRFTTGALPLPGVPTLLTPALFATGVGFPVMFTWTSVPSAASYHLQVGTSTAFNVLVVNDSSLITNARQTSGSMAALTDYYWRVRAKNTTGAGEWSTPSRFTTGESSSLRPGQLLVSGSGAFSEGSLTFALEHPTRVTVRLSDLRGRTLAPVIDEIRPAGRHVIELPPGDGALRLLEFRAGDHVVTRLLPP